MCFLLAVSYICLYLYPHICILYFFIQSYLISLSLVYYLSIYICLSTYTYLPACLPACLPAYLPAYLSISTLNTNLHTLVPFSYPARPAEGDMASAFPRSVIHHIHEPCGVYNCTKP